MKAFGKHTNLTHIQLSLAIQNFRYDTLRASFRQVGLCETVFIHEILKYL